MIKVFEVIPRNVRFKGLRGRGAILGREAASLKMKRALQKALLEEDWLQVLRGIEDYGNGLGIHTVVERGYACNGCINTSVTSGG